MKNEILKLIQSKKNILLVFSKELSLNVVSIANELPDSESVLLIDTKTSKNVLVNVDNILYVKESSSLRR